MCQADSQMSPKCWLALATILYIPLTEAPRTKPQGVHLMGMTGSQLGLGCFFTSLMPLEPPVDTSHLKSSPQAMRPLALTPASGDPTFLPSLCSLNTPGTGLPQGLDTMSPGSPHLTQVTSQGGQCSLLTCSHCDTLACGRDIHILSRAHLRRTLFQVLRLSVHCLSPPSRPVVPNLFGTRDRFHGRQFFHGPGVGGDSFQIIKAHYIYRALYF